MKRYIYDYSKLIGRMAEKGYKRKDIAKLIDKTEPAVTHRLNNKIEFDQSEMLEIGTALDIPIEQLPQFFLVKKLLKN